MRKIINGKAYDTDTATEVCECGTAGELPRGDFRRWKGTLYKTPNGRFFMVGEGGPMTLFARHHADGGSSGGAGLIALDAAQARHYAERAGADVEAFFPVVEA